MRNQITQMKMCISAGVGWMLCINFAILLPWVQPSVQRKYDLQKNEKYCVLGGKKSNATRRSWKQFSNPLTVGGWRGGEGCSPPVAHQSGCSTISNISGNSLDLFVNVLRVFWILTVHWGRRSAPHLWEGLDRPHCNTTKSSKIRVAISRTLCSSISSILYLFITSSLQFGVAHGQVLLYVGHHQVLHMNLSCKHFHFHFLFCLFLAFEKISSGGEMCHFGGWSCAL